MLIGPWLLNKNTKTQKQPLFFTGVRITEHGYGYEARRHDLIPQQNGSLSRLGNTENAWAHARLRDRLYFSGFGFGVLGLLRYHWDLGYGCLFLPSPLFFFFFFLFFFLDFVCVSWLIVFLSFSLLSSSSWVGLVLILGDSDKIWKFTFTTDISEWQLLHPPPTHKNRPGPFKVITSSSTSGPTSLLV